MSTTEAIEVLPMENHMDICFQLNMKIKQTRVKLGMNGFSLSQQAEAALSAQTSWLTLNRWTQLIENDLQDR